MRTAAILTAVCLVVAGCGGKKSAGADYNACMAAVLPATQAVILKQRLALEEVHVPQVGKLELQHIERRLATTIAALRKITPPAAVAKDHQALIRGYIEALADFHGLDPLTSKPITDQLRVQAGRLAEAPALTDAGAAIEAIRSKGYDLGFPAGS